MTEIAVHIEDISKIYKLYASPSDRLKETFHFFRKIYHHDFYALKNISFDIEKGKTIGLIGQNGAGKSTLLKILTGVLTPSSGQYTVNGKVSSLLELGSGFNPELTGIENVYFNGALFGFSNREIDEKFDDILAFADIGEFINQKVKTYSSGMFVRLAFAVAVQVDPDILIVDEALSVGDMRFQQKCFRRLKAFKDSGKTVLFVTHDHGTVTNFCDYVYWIKDGVLFDHGVPAKVVKKYISYMSYGMDTNDNVDAVEPTGIPQKTKSGVGDAKEIEWEDISSCSSFGEGGVKISDIAMYYRDCKEKIHVIKGGESVTFFMKLHVKQTIENPGIGIGISVNDHLGNTVFAIPSFAYDVKFPKLLAGNSLCCKILFDFPEVRNGKYSVAAAVAEGTLANHFQHHWLHDIYFVEVVNTDLKYSLGTIVIKKSEFDISFESE